jgi:hypothetical protein
MLFEGRRGVRLKKPPSELVAAVTTRMFDHANSIRAAEAAPNIALSVIAHAKEGSVADAKLLLLLAAKYLRERGPAAPFDQIAALPGWLADYLADSLLACVTTSDPSKALNLKARPGNSRFTVDAAIARRQRNAKVAYYAAALKYLSSRNYLKRTATLLTDADVTPPNNDGWTSHNVRDCIKAHENLVRLNAGI